MRIILLLLISFNVHSGVLTWITHEGTETRSNCTMINQSMSDMSRINVYNIRCHIKIPYIKSVTIYQNNDVSKVVYGKRQFSCPLILGSIESRNKFELVFDCREWL